VTIEESLKTEGLTKLIIGNAGEPLIISDVPELWWDEFARSGFIEYASFQDYWIDDLVSPELGQDELEFLTAEECPAASEVTFACQGTSRGFEGQPPEWFVQWLRGEAKGLGCNSRNAAILIHKIGERITGLSCTATYAHGSEKGAIVWVRMLAVHPDFQRRGIGRKLLAQTLCYGTEHGAKRAFLQTDTQNSIAQKLYLDAGFLPRKCERQADMVWRDAK